MLQSEPRAKVAVLGRDDVTAVVGRWENEGGAGRRGRPLWRRVFPRLSLDDRQDQLMGAASSEGSPPAKWLRVVEWRWFGIGAAAVVVAFGGWVVLAEVGAGTIVPAVGYAMLMLCAASPVLVAGLMRGGEERAARRVAVAERATVQPLDARTAERGR
jgi:hypothetical protein